MLWGKYSESSHVFLVHTCQARGALRLFRDMRVAPVGNNASVDSRSGIVREPGSESEDTSECGYQMEA